MNKRQMSTVTRALKPFLAKGKSFRQNRKGQKIILTYHGISDRSRFNCVSVKLFRDHLAWLREHYRVVSLSELVRSLSSEGQRQSNLVAVTCDDGYANFAEVALPVVEEFGYHVTVFVPSGKVGGYNDWDEGASGFERMPLMTHGQLRQLPEESVEVGSHGVSHIRLDRLPADAVEREILRSKRDIEEAIGRPVRFFAYPHGACPSPWRKVSGRDARNPLGQYRAVCTTRWGRFNSIDTVFSLRRIAIWDSDTFEDFLDKLNGCYDWLAAKESVGRFLRGVREWKKGSRRAGRAQVVP